MRRWENNIKIDLKESMCEDVDWMHVAQDMNQMRRSLVCGRKQWRDLVNTVIKVIGP
jgi:hypothetical protein